MKAKLSEIAPGTCFQYGKKGRTAKKLEDGRVVSAKANGKARKRKMKGDPLVEPVGCSLELIGLGLRRNPEQVLEIGSARPRRRRT